VKFTRPAAQRIAAAVRHVEVGNRDQPPFCFEHPQGIGSNAKVFRICTFTGTWAINTSQVVQYYNVTSTPNTVQATNVFLTLGGSTSTSVRKNCAIAKDGTAWYIIAAQCG
jgi:hypothetical protein